MQKLLLPFFKKAVFTAICLLLLPFSSRACDTSGYQMLDIIDNGNGTFTIQWLVMVAGGTSTGVGSTWGFNLNVGSPILSVQPSSLTSSQSGLTIGALVTGQTVTWGNPVPSPAAPFVNIAIHPDDEQWLVTIVVQGAPTVWNGGGQEGNLCPGGSGTGGNYNGTYPCFDPVITPVNPMISICAGTPATLAVIPNHLVKTISWSPGGATGPNISVIGTVDQTYTITAVGNNPNCPTTATIDVVILPQPMISAINPDIEACPGQPAVMQVEVQDVNTILWMPLGAGPVLVATPSTSPAIYTATGTNQCGSASTTFTVIVNPAPTVTTSAAVTICQGESTQLIAVPTNADNFMWQPIGSGSEEILVSPAVTTTYFAVAQNQCGVAQRSVKVTVVPNSMNTLNLSACPGKTVTYNGLQLAAGSSSMFTFDNVAGCDSVVTVNVAAAQNSTATKNLKACQGSTVAFMGQNLAPNTSTLFTLVSANGCDSLLTVNVASSPIYNTSLNLQACVGTTVSYAGQNLAAGSTTAVKLMSVAGCDSTVSVAVAALPIFSSALTLQTCPNKTVTYRGQQLAANTTTPFTLKAKNGCDSVVTVSVIELAVLTSTINAKACTGTTFPYNGQNLLPNSTANFTFVSSQGCDSIVTVNVAEITKFQTNINLTACTGNSVMSNGQSILAGTLKIFNYTTSLGCDSTVTVTVAALPVFSSALKIRTCPDEPVFYANKTLAVGSVTPIKLTAKNGCDSIVTVTVEAIQTPPRTLNLTACKGTTVFYGGQNLAANTTTPFILNSYQGCDSVVTVIVAELPTFSNAVNLQACQGFSAIYNGVSLPPGTNLNFTFQAKNGCDSVVAVTVEEVQGFQTNLNLKACPGDFANYQGQQLAVGSVTNFDFTALAGCDSTVTVTVSALPLAASILTLKACPNKTVGYNGQQLAAGSTTNFTFLSANGCDSTVTVNVQTLPILMNSLSLKACIGGTVLYSGQNLAVGAMQDFTFQSVVTGCDSIVSVAVTALAPISSALTLKTCAGVSVLYNGQSLQAGSVTPFVLQTPKGCDSTVTVSVVVGPPLLSALKIQTCIGKAVTYAGQTLQPNSVTPIVLQTPAGCDSTVTVTVEEVAVIKTSVNLKACPGETALFNGQNLLPGTVQDFNFLSQNGCDSVVTVTVKALQNAAKSVFLKACTGETVLFNGQNLQPNTVKIFDFFTFEGCDSTVTVTVKELFPQATTVNLQACTGTTILYNGQPLLPNSTQVFDLQTFDGCDSAVTVSVAEVSVLTTSLTVTGCEGDAIPYANTTILTGQSKQFTFPSSLGCDSIVTVSAIGIPPKETEERIEICPGKTVDIFGIARGSAGFYDQTFVAANGCDSTHTVELAIVNPVSLSFPAGATIDLGGETTLLPNAAPPTGLEFSWQIDTTLSCADCPTPVAMPIKTTTYFLTVTDADGCSASAFTTLKVDKKRNVYIPNSFSPNDDGLNDLFLVFADDRSVKTIRAFKIFSRWGESVHELINIQPNDVASAWNGRQRGKDLTCNVYVYFAEIEFIDGVVEIYKGDVTILK